MSTLKVAAINNPSASSGGLAISASGNVTGAGLDLITTQSFSAVSSVSINNCFSATYDNYRVLVSEGAADSTTTRNLNLRLRVGGVDNSGTSEYNWNILYQYGSSTVGGTGGNGTAMNLVAFSGVDKNMALSLDLFSPARTWRTLATCTAWRYQNDTSAWVFSTSGGAHTVATAYDGFTLYPASGTFSGVVSVYGYRK